MMASQALARQPSVDTSIDAVSFNLLDSPWIPVLDRRGSEREVSLREAILQSHEYRDLVGELPTMRFAILRILLSIVYRALDRDPGADPVDAWAELWETAELPQAPLEQYLGEWHDRFDLLDAEQPFLQSPGLRTAGDEWKPISLIVADTDPDGALFTMRSELASLPLAEAARWLVHAHAYDYSGIKSGVVGDQRVKGGKAYPMGLGACGWFGGIALTGRDLRETILLNLIPGSSAKRPNDAPMWERPAPGPGPRDPEEIGTIGPIGLMTWPQRRIRLRVEGTRATGVLVTNGDELDYTMLFGTELMTGWRFSEPQSAKAKAPRYMPRKIDSSRALWRGLGTLLTSGGSDTPASQKVKKKWNVPALSEPAAIITWLEKLVQERVIPQDRAIEVSAVSMDYGTQNASYAEVVSDRLAFKAALADLAGGAALLALAQDAVGRAEQAVRALGRLAIDLDRAAGGDGGDSESGPGANAEADAFATLDRRFREWLLELAPERDGNALLAAWTEDVRGLVRERAHRLVETAPDTAWIGRRSSDGSRSVSVADAIQYFEAVLFRTLGAPLKRTTESRNGAQNDE